MVSKQEIMTAEQLLVYRDPADRRTELVRGRLMVSEPLGWEQGKITLEAGTALVWTIDAERREARVYRADGTQSVVGQSGARDGEGMLPGFALSMEQVLGR